MKDIASLAIDGGTMIIDVVEDEATGTAKVVAPIPLVGIIERIDQICASRISPPLTFAQSDRLRDPADPSRGLLVIEVPATGVPHMADGVYVGRDNKTTRRLAHEEVVRYLSRRDGDADYVGTVLDRAYDTMGTAGMPVNRLVVVATPVPVLRPEACACPSVTTAGGPGLADQIQRGSNRFQKARSSVPALAELTYADWSSTWSRTYCR